MSTITAAILAGGESRRMGRDKALLDWNGKPLLAQVARAANAAGLDVLVVGRTEPAGWDIGNCRFLPDEVPDLGPLGGLVSALRNSPGPVLVLACDLPLLTSAAVVWLRDQSLKAGPDRGIVAVTDRRQQLFAVYHQALLPTAVSRLRGDDRSLRGLIATGAFVEAHAPHWVESALAQANTPEEWEALRGSQSLRQ